jgi:hypothetical protein
MTRKSVGHIANEMLAKMSLEDKDKAVQPVDEET